MSIKNSPVDIGSFGATWPTNWKWESLGTLADIRGGVGFPPSLQGRRAGDCPFYKVSDMNLLGNEVYMFGANNYISSNDIAGLRAKPFKAGTLIFPKVGAAVHTNKKRLLSVDALIDNNVMGVTPTSSSLDAFFLLAWFQLLNLSDLSNPGTLPSINGNTTARVPVPLPPLAEQRAIADILRAAQESRKCIERELAALKTLRLSLVSRVLAVAGDEGAVSTTLGEVLIEGPKNGVYKPASDYGSGTQIVRIDDYPNEGDELSRVAKRVRLVPSEATDYALRDGDLLVNRVNSLSHLGKTALIVQPQEDMIFESNMMRLRVDRSRVLPTYIFLVLTSAQARAHFRGCAKRAVGQSSINQGDVKGVPVVLPSLSLQAKIVSFIQLADRCTRLTETKLRDSVSLSSSLLHHLMTGKVRIPEFAKAEQQGVVA
jgi:type I restriction enzyme, S subunit